MLPVLLLTPLSITWLGLCCSQGWWVLALWDTDRDPGSQWCWASQKIAGRRLFFGSCQIFSAGPKPACDSACSLRHAKALCYTTANKQWPSLDQKLYSLIRSRLDFFFLMNWTLWKHEPLGLGPTKGFRMCWVVGMCEYQCWKNLCAHSPAHLGPQDSAFCRIYPSGCKNSVYKEGNDEEIDRGNRGCVDLKNPFQKRMK